MKLISQVLFFFSAVNAQRSDDSAKQIDPSYLKGGADWDA